MTETWLCAQGDEAKTVELAPSGFDVKSFPRQSCCGEFTTIYKSFLNSNMTFKINFDFTRTSFEVVQVSITLQHNIIHFFYCTALHTSDETILRTMLLIVHTMSLYLTTVLLLLLYTRVFLRVQFFGLFSTT